MRSDIKIYRNKFCLPHTDIFSIPRKCYYAESVKARHFTFWKICHFPLISLVCFCEIYFSLFTTHFQCKRSAFCSADARAFDRFHIYFLFAMNILCFKFCCCSCFCLQNVHDFIEKYSRKNACIAKCFAQCNLSSFFTIMFYCHHEHTHTHTVSMQKLHFIILWEY